MKQVINHKIYDTETAIFIADASYSYSNDFNYWEENLYRTKSGNYFIQGEGGPMSRYAVSVGNNNITGSSNIKPLSTAAALEWCEYNKVDADIIAEHFLSLLEEA